MKNTKHKKTVQYGAPIITWKAPEFREIHRGPIWAMGAGICALLLIGWAIWQNTYAFAVVVLLLAGIYFLTHNKKPKEVEIHLTTNGIKAGERFYPYMEMQTFWVIFLPDKDVKTLNFIMKSGVIKEVSLEMEDEDPAEVRSFLSGHVYELEGRTETFLEKTIRVLKL